jgi:hypothetical protein
MNVYNNAFELCGHGVVGDKFWDHNTYLASFRFGMCATCGCIWFWISDNNDVMHKVISNCPCYNGNVGTSITIDCEFIMFKYINDDVDNTIKIWNVDFKKS